jgi:uncharacterized protein (DUF58 family)
MSKASKSSLGLPAEGKSSAQMGAGAKTAIISGAVAAAAIGACWYLEHRRNHQVVLSPNEIAFGEVPVGQRADAVFLLSNRTNTAVMISSIAEPELFQISSTQPLPVTLTPGMTAVFRVTFNPTAIGKFKERISIAISDIDQVSSRRVSVAIEGTSVQPVPALTPVSLSGFMQAAGSIPSGISIP